MGNFRQGNNRGGFNNGGRSSGSRFRGGESSRRDHNFRGFERRPLEMHEATCDKCGKQCRVPFKPTGNKPIYCSDCFEKTGNSRTGDRDFGRGVSDISSSKLDEINLKLDKIMKSLNLE